MIKNEPITLEGKSIILRHPSIDDSEGLSIAARDGEIWNSPVSKFPHPNEMQKYIQEMLDLSSRGLIFPFITIDKDTEAKFLMLQYASEKLECIAVEIHTYVLNTVSRKAIQRLGAKQDGVLRHHKIMGDGRIRDTVCYNMIKSEREEVKENPVKKLYRYSEEKKLYSLYNES